MSEKQAFKWNEEGKKSFESIKEAIGNVPVLVNPNFKKDFIINCYASEHTMSGILLQKNEDNEEVPISFMSVPLKKHDLKYSLMEKQAYALVKAVKQFRYYILHSNAVVYVPHFAVKSILTQQDIGMNNRASWVSKIQEFNLDIKPTILVRGQGLCKLIAESKSEVIEELTLVLFVRLQDSWFADVVYYLTYGDCPMHLSLREKWSVILKASKYVIFNDVLYKRGMFKDAYAWVAKCEKCKLFTSKPQLAALPLRPVIVDEPFKQWGLDFIGPLMPTSSVGHTHILKTTNYFTKWVEAILVRKTTSKGNGQAESSNKNLINIMKKLVSENFKDWHKKLYEALGVDRTLPKRATRMSPFELVSGMGAQLAIPLELAAIKLQTVIEDAYF
ncbi:uncharacterized protein LOC131073577 [Cryptomeria japonica]|uniref:uncharacterized protein LOC131073577 n=1 Tax=Cryptomeria japonica TaxID=3369 RepID=UPI0027DA1E5A|nr:uncharacterized protein LOC131073577 [Cryptomeria japonica]